MKTAASPIKYVLCEKKEAAKLYESVPTRAKGSIPGIAMKSIIERLGGDHTAALEGALAALFPDEPVEKARRRMTTEIANRVYKDDAGVAPLKIAMTRKGVEPALIWIECPERGDASQLTEVGDRYAAKAFVPAEAVRKTSAEIVVDIISEKAVARGRIVDETSPSVPADESPPSSEANTQSLNTDAAFQTNATLNAARGQAIHNATKQTSAVNDSLRGVDNKNFTATDGRLHQGLGGFGETVVEQRGRTVNALHAMLDWANDKGANASRLLALLGDYGTGKTSHALQFSRILNGDVESAKRTPQSPSALHIDLAFLRGAPGLAQLNVTQIIDIVIGARGLKDVLSAIAVVSEVREGRRIVVYDGLDELMQTDHAQLHSVFRQLLQIFEPDPVTRAPSRARAIVSCRTHYFRDLSEQHQFFDTQSRGSVSSKDYLCLYLLPWTQDTVREYLAKRLSAAEAKALEETIRTTYNLEELASRPVLLAMMCEQVNEILRLRDANGGTITASTLYAQTVAMWVHRDNEKHILQPTHKPILMGALACAMWNDGKEQWDADQLDRWLRKTVDLLFPGHYAPEQTRAIQDDLRTATFIVRHSASGDKFVFAHRSFQEFFLARHLVALTDWSDLPEITLRSQRLLLPENAFNSETLNFIAELIARNKEVRDNFAQKIWSWLTYDLGVERTDGYTETPAPAPICHAALFRTICTLGLSASDTEKRINLRFARLQHFQAKNLQLPPIDARRADFTLAKFYDCRITSLWALEASLQGTLFRDCRISEVVTDRASTNGLLFRSCVIRDSQADSLLGPWQLPEQSDHPTMRRRTGETTRLVYADEEITLILVRETVLHCWNTSEGRVVWQNSSRVRDRYFDGLWWFDKARDCVVHLVRRSGEAEEFRLADGDSRVMYHNAAMRQISPGFEALAQHEDQLKSADAAFTQSYVFKKGHLAGCTRYFVHGSNPSTACFDAAGRLVDYDEEAADTWLRYLGNGYPQPVEAAWCELDEFGRVLGPKKAPVAG